jgi:hypothetical protein
MDKEDSMGLLGEVEDLLRTAPPRDTLDRDIPENDEWFGRAAALVEKWNPAKIAAFMAYQAKAISPSWDISTPATRQLFMLLNQMRSDLMLRTRGPLTAAVGRGMVFDYFDELRKIIEPARTDLLFVDPYLDADFVPRYLPHVAAGVTIRLLASKKLPTLMPAVQAFRQQQGAAIEVRSAASFHDRYVFVDRAACYQSGASFKDGAKSAPTTLTQITDAFAVVQRTYEDLWSAGTVQG